MLGRGILSLCRVSSVSLWPSEASLSNLAQGKSLYGMIALVTVPLSKISTTAAYHASSVKDSIIVIPMPQLSPHMESGLISKWLKNEGDEIATYDVIFEVETTTLSEEAYKVGNFAGTVTMLVEAQEEGYLSKILVGEKKEVKVGTSVAVMCELEENLEELAAGANEVKKLLEEPEKLKKLTWQSYLKDGGESKGCS